jgi:hypothetical protein
MSGKLITREYLLDKINAAYGARDLLYRVKKDSRSLRWEKLWNMVQERTQPVSVQRLLEAKWLINYTDDWTRADSILNRVEVDGTAPQGPLSQDADGSWGPGYTEPYHRLEPTVDALQRDWLDSQKNLKPLTFMKPFENPDFVVSYLSSLRLSRLRETGRNHRGELGAVMTAMSQLIFKKKIRDALLNHPELDFHISPELEKTYTNFLWSMQSPDTGYWGPSYEFGGERFDVQDLSFTFHVAHYYENGYPDDDRKAPNLPAIARTTLAIVDYWYPNGWRATRSPKEPRFSDHHNYDAVTLFACAWPALDEPLRKQVRPVLQEVLDWCLTRSLNGDRFNDAGLTDVESYYFGVKFLNVIGFWKPESAFWPEGPLQVPAGTAKPQIVARRLLDRFAAEVDDHTEAADTTKEVLNAALSGTPISFKL